MMALARAHKGSGAQLCTAFTPEARRDIVARLEEGHVLEVAAALSGIGMPSLRRWLMRGAQHVHMGMDGDFAEFSIAVNKAQAVSVGELWVAVLSAARAGDVKAAQWALSKHSPAKFGERIAVQQEDVAVRPDAPASEDEARQRWEAIGRRNGWLV